MSHVAFPPIVSAAVIGSHDHRAGNRQDDGYRQESGRTDGDAIVKIEKEFYEVFKHEAPQYQCDRL